MMTCASSVTRFEKQKQMRCFWELRSSSSCGELSSFLQTYNQNNGITHLFTSTEIACLQNICQSKEDILRSSLSATMAHNGVRLPLRNEPQSPYLQTNATTELGSTYHEKGNDDATVESQPIKIESMRELWDAAIGYALEQNKMLKEQQHEFKLKSDRKLNSPWTPSPTKAISPNLEFGNAMDSFSTPMPTCAQLELKKDEDTFVKVEQRKQEWDAKISPPVLTSSPGSPSGAAISKQGLGSTFGCSDLDQQPTKVQPCKEAKREVVLKDMHNDKEKENDLKRKQLLFFKQTRAPAPPIVVIREKNEVDTAATADLIGGVSKRAEDTSPAQKQIEVVSAESSSSSSVKNHQCTTIGAKVTSASISVPSSSSNVAKCAESFDHANRIVKDQSQNDLLVGCDSQSSKLVEPDNGSTDKMPPVMPSVKTKKAPLPPPQRKKIDEAIINTFQHGGTESNVIIINKM